MTREEMFAALTRRPIPFDSGGFHCHLRPLKASEHAELVAWQKDHGSDKNYQFFFARCVVDASGSRILSDEDAAALADSDFPIVDAVVNKILDMNGFSGKDQPGESRTPS